MLRDFLKEPVVNNNGKIQLDKVEKFIQFNFDTNEKIGGVFIINNLFIAYSKKNGYKSIINIVNSIQRFSNSNFHLINRLYTEIESGNKITVDRLSTDYSEKSKFIEDRKDLCNVTKIGSYKKHLIHRKQYFYKCVLQRLKYVKVSSVNEPMPPKAYFISDSEVSNYKNIGLGGFLYQSPTNKQIFVDEELNMVFKRERRLSIINEL